MPAKFVIKGLIIDMDGVLWRGPQPIGDLTEIFRQVGAHGWKFILATNNATRTIPQYLDKLYSFGVRLEPWQIISSAEATARHLQKKHPEGGPVFIVGEHALVETLQGYGFYASTNDPIAVIASLDRQISYEKLKLATLFIRRGVSFIATNPDRTFPSPEGLLPGAGSIVACLQAAGGEEPTFIGKPAPEMFLQALNRLETPPHQTLVVGDRIETDIAGGKTVGCHTALVLSGVTPHANLDPREEAPDFVTQDLTHLLRALPK